MGMKKPLIGIVTATMFAMMVPLIAQQSTSVGDAIRSGSGLGSYQEISQRYDVTAVPELIHMINTTSDMPYWEKAVGVLGVVGDDRAVDALIELVERQPVDATQVRREWSHARRQSLISLGFLIHRTGNQKALEYLIASLGDSVWRQRGVTRADSNMSLEMSHKVLSEFAVMGLALSGHPRAGAALRALQQSPAPNQAALRDGLDDTLNSWLGEVYPLVVERGLLGMYDYYDQRPNEVQP
jgi:hypothetical protein